MARRSAAHGKDKKAIFEVFLAAHPAFAAEVKSFEQPDDEFPDIVAGMKDGAEVDFEVGEWLDGSQIAAAKRYGKLAAAILDAIGPQQPNLCRHFRAVMLCPSEDPAAFNAADKADFKASLMTLSVRPTSGSPRTGSGTRPDGGSAATSPPIRRSHRSWTAPICRAPAPSA